jgi:hypothetical protein
VVVDPFVQIVQHSKSVGGGEMDFGLLERIDLSFGFKIVHRHD